MDSSEKTWSVPNAVAVQASLTADGAMTIRAEAWDRKAFTAELSKTRQSMKMGTSVMEELRGGARY